MFTGSTSSLSGLLSQIYFLISAHKNPDLSDMTSKFDKLQKGFSPGQLLPTALKFTRSKVTEDFYSLDSISDGDDGKNILSVLVRLYVLLIPPLHAS